ncbi:MAG TPA: PAS domain S-box protein [Burkholderiaceae bacterium]|nr:PAS domain S-box protein [Burkholderiaceae bacterium]HQR71387.1 PAS domain S-box protein [Burkholderiaceae bacterium]
MRAPRKPVQAGNSLQPDEDAGLQEVLERTTAAALAVSSAEPGRVFEDLALGLARVLGTDAALIAEFVDDGRQRMRTLALCFEGRLLRAVEYDVSQTPCRHIVGRASRFVPQGVNPEFAPGTLFAAQGFDAYAGYSIPNAAGEQLGIIVALNRRPIAGQQLTEALLKIFAMRAAAEMERVRAQAALAASETSYRAIFDANEDAIFVHDWATGTILDVSPRASDLFGYPREALCRLRVGDISANVPPYTEAEAVGHIERAKVSAGPLRFEWHARHRDGHLMWNEVTLKRAEIAGQPRVLAFVRDVTERKQAEEALRASEEQYRAIFEAAADSLQLLDAQHRVVDVNPAYERMYGKRREDVVGKTLTDLVPAPLREERRALVERALAGETAELLSTGFRGDGTPFDLEVRVIPFQHRGKPHVLGIARDITGRRRAEEAMRASEEQYRAIFNASADALVLRDADFRIVDVNATYERMSGWKRSEVLGIDRVVANPADVAPTIRTLHARALGGETIVLEVPLVRRDGTRYELELRGVPIRHRGQPHVLYMGRDVTERKRAEEALRASEEQYRAIFNASADALVLWNNQYRRVDVNTAYQRMYGWAREDVIGKGYEDPRFPAEYARTRLDLVRRALAGEDCKAELEAIRSDGSRIRTEVHAIPFRHRGEPHVLAIARDITERKHAEEALRASEEQYRAIFNASADAMLLRDDTMLIVDANPAFLALCGLQREQVIGSKRAPFVTEAFEEGAARVLNEAMKGVRGTLLAQTRSFDGTVLDVEVRAIPMLYRGRRHVLAISRNITGEKRAEAERRRFEAQLRQAQKMEAIGQLTGGIAHDFNNILASVMGYVVLAEERVTDVGDAKSVEYLDEALASCRRARDLIQQMLTFSRGGRGEPRALSLTAIVREALPMLRSALPSMLEIDLDTDDTVPAVWMDEVQAHQVLLNLAINARDAMPEGGALRISVHRVEVQDAVCTSCRAAFSGPHVELAVADRGKGIEAALLERIFDPFFSTKALGKGSGMGLSMVHGIVHEHGGHVIVESEPGMGSRFRILLPVHSAAAQKVGRSAGARSGREPLRGRVLLVDDEPSVLAVMRETLSSWGLEVEACPSADHALRTFGQSGDRVDLLVTDQAMPGLTGIDLAARLRQQRPDLPWVLCTGYADADSEALARQAGASAVLLKPIERARLRAALEAALGPRAGQGPSPSAARFAEFEATALAEGFDEVVERRWDADEVLEPHRHPFAVRVLVVAGEMWLTRGDMTQHLLPGETFEIARNELHGERYGPQGAIFWSARRHAT